MADAMDGMAPAFSNIFSNETLARGLSMIRAASNSMLDDPELTAMRRELKAVLSCCHVASLWLSHG